MTYRRTITIRDDLYKKINRIRGEIMFETIKDNTFTEVVNIALDIGLDDKEKIKELLRDKVE